MLVWLRFVCEWSAGACWTFTCSSLLVLNCLSFRASLIIFDSCLYNILRYLQSLHALGPKPEKSSWECRIVEGIYAIEYRDTALHNTVNWNHCLKDYKKNGLQEDIGISVPYFHTPPNRAYPCFMSYPWMKWFANRFSWRYHDFSGSFVFFYIQRSIRYCWLSRTVSVFVVLHCGDSTHPVGMKSWSNCSSVV